LYIDHDIIDEPLGTMNPNPWSLIDRYDVMDSVVRDGYEYID
jgi:hypothetical protein